MAFDFPWQMFLQAQQARTQNQRNMYHDIAGIGLGLGEGMEGLGEAFKRQRLMKVIEDIKNQNQPSPIVPTATENTAQQSLPLEHPASTQPQRQFSFDPEKVGMDVMGADPSTITSLLPAMIAGHYRMMRSQRPGKATLPVAFGPSGLRANPGGTLGAGDVGGELPYDTYITKMMGQQGRKESQDKFEATMTKEVDAAMLPFKGAEETLDAYEKLYKKVYATGEGGWLKGTVGSALGSLTKGKVNRQLFMYGRTKQERMHTLATSLGIGRFNLAAIAGISNALPTGGEARMEDGLALISSLRDSIKNRREKALSDLKYRAQMMRGVMGLDRGYGGATASNEPDTSGGLENYEE